MKRLEGKVVVITGSTRFFAEGNPDHPADFEGVSYFTPEEISQLLAKNQSQSEQIKKILFRDETGYYMFY